MRRVHLLCSLAAVLLGCAAGVRGQDPSDSNPGRSALDRPTELGLRFTPEMARAMARLFTEEVAAKRYNLDAGKVDEATENVARRIMGMAHKLDQAGYHERMEHLVAEFIRGQIEERGEGDQGILKPEVAKAISEASKQFMPALREMVQGVSKDIRPMLATKDQLTFAGDLMAMSTGMDIFEKSMQRWEKGDVKPYENPFTDEEKEVKKDGSGQSERYNNAKQAAQREIDNAESNQWKRYVEEAKKFYGFDEAQSNTADSVLRESLERAQAITQDGQWREKMFRNRVWSTMLWELRTGPNHPLRVHLDNTHDAMFQPIRAIGDDLKGRIDAIPTQAQRAAADDRVMKLLAAQGFQEPSASQPGESKTENEPSGAATTATADDGQKPGESE